MSSKFQVRLARGRDDARRLYAFLTSCHLEIGNGAVDHGKAFAKVLDIVDNHAAVIVEDEAGEIVGSTGIEQYQVWYGDTWELGDIWFFVRRDLRGSEVASLMVDECGKIADAAGASAILIINNASPPGRRRVESLGRLHHFEPRGHLLRINPRNAV